jgi:hypothetical protein
MPLSLEEWDEIQRRTIDPFWVNESNAVNRLTRMLTFGKDCVLENYNKNCELVDYKTVKVKSGHYTKDDVLIYFDQDINLDFTDELNYWSTHNNQFDEAGVYYVVLHYIYSESLPHPIATYKIVKDYNELTEHVLNLCNVNVIYNTTNARYEIESINFQNVSYIRSYHLYNDQYTIDFESLINLAIADNETPNNYVKFNGGKILDKPNRKYRVLDELQIGPFNPVSSSTKKRFDLLSIDFNGNVNVNTGSEISINDDFTTVLTTTVLPENQYPIAFVLVDETTSVEITRYDIFDVRDFLSTPYWLESIIDDINYLISILGRIRGGYNPSNPLPTGDISAGDYWYVTHNGTVSGLGELEPGDVIVSKVENPSSASQWSVIQANIIDAVFPQTTSSVVDHIPIYSNTNGRVLKDSGVSIDEYGVMHLPPGGGLSVSGGDFDMGLGDLDNVSLSGLVAGHGIVYNGSVFVNTTLVTSLNGRTGNVTLSKSDVGLDNVVNVASPPITRAIMAGNGLTGGGDLSANRTIALGTPSTLNTSTGNTLYSGSHTHSVAFPVTKVNNKTGSFSLTYSDVGASATSHTHSNITITAGNGLSGGGALSASRTITLGIPSTLNTGTGNASHSSTHTHSISYPVNSVNGHIGSFSITYLDVGAAASTHTHSNLSVSAGNGLTGGGTLSASRTLALGTPGTLTTSTLNSSSSTSHTHEVDFPVTSVNGEFGNVTVGIDMNDSVGGDLTGTFANPEVAKIRNKSVSYFGLTENDVLMNSASYWGNVTRNDMFGSPSTDDVIIYTGTSWVPAEWGEYEYDPSTSYPISTITKYHPYNRYMGTGVAVNGDLMVIAKSTQVLTYIYNGASWDLVHTLPSPILDGVGLNRYSSSILAVGSANTKKVNIYIWLDGEWVFRDQIYESSKTNFGASVALNGDGSILAVGSINENRVYIYTHDGTSWSLRDTINASTGEAGKSVSLTPDGNRLVIGRSKATHSYIEEGDIQVYDYDGTSWSLVTTLTDSHNDYTHTGRAVSISDDGETIYVGQIGFQGIYVDQGRVVVYTWDGSSWATTYYMESSSAASGNWFGYSLCVTRAQDALAVGSPGHDGIYSNEGKVEIIRI